MIPLILRDLKIAMRAGGGFGLSVVFFSILVLLLPFAVGPDTDLLARVVGGVLWIGALLATLLCLDRVFALDFEDGTLEQLALAPLPLEMVFLAKAIAHWLTTGLPLGVAAVPLAEFLNFEPQARTVLFMSLFIGTPALSMIGGFCATLTLGIKRGGAILSVLVLPLYIPTLIYGAKATQLAQKGLNAHTPLLLLTCVTLGCVGLLPFAAAGALRVNLR